MSNTLTNLTSKQLRRAASLRDAITALEKKLAATLSVAPEAPAPVRQARRASKKTAVSVASPLRAPRFSKAARAKMAAAAKRRWAAARAAGKKSL